MRIPGERFGFLVVKHVGIRDFSSEIVKGKIDGGIGRDFLGELRRNFPEKSVVRHVQVR